MNIMRTLLAVMAAAFLAGCAVSPEPGSLSYDPFSEENRGVHEANKYLDRTVYGPVARSYGRATPSPVRQGVSNVRNNWRLPSVAVYRVLQGDPAGMLKSSSRFAINTVLGVGGLFDPARHMGLPYEGTDFDETMFVWGVPEGGYLEMPFAGPGTQRSWAGWAVDFVLDPMNFVLPDAGVRALTAVGALDVVNTRYELDPVIQALLHESLDSYSAQRISYLQNYRARLQGGTDLDQLEDIYADF